MAPLMQNYTLFLRVCVLTMLTDSESTVILVLGRLSMYFIDLTLYMVKLEYETS
jgi:predicted DNA-binding ribbon-helix-helix protein